MRPDPAAPFLAPYHPARAWLLRRGLYLLLAFDAWLVMLEHGGRYGAGNFNVAHFAWLDALLSGLPLRALYVGALIAAGTLALTLAFVRASRAARLLLALVYTASWAISLHDSYQHHYLLSWLLLWSAFVPEPTHAELMARPPDPLRAVGLSLSAFTCSIVYAFTALSKAAPEWRSGEVLTRLASRGSVLARLRDALASASGQPPAQVLLGLAWSLIALQLLVALAYCAAPGRDSSLARPRARFDRSPAPLRAWLCHLGLGAALAFHLGTELSGSFEIGWFSYYMLWTAAVLLAPTAWIAGLAGLCARGCAALARGLAAFPLTTRVRAFAVSGALACALVAIGAALDLPGALAACTLLALLGLGSAYRRYTRGAAGELAALLAAASLAAVCLWGALTWTAVRFDFYRRWAGEVARMGQLDEALVLYRRAERHAPPGKSRAKQIYDLEQRLRD